MTDTKTTERRESNREDRQERRPRREGDKPFRPRPRREDEDDKGSVQDCFICGMAYFSRWETDKPFSASKRVPDPEDLECDRCVTERIYLRNMQLLQEQKKG